MRGHTKCITICIKDTLLQFDSLKKLINHKVIEQYKEESGNWLLPRSGKTYIKGKLSTRGNPGRTQ